MDVVGELMSEKNSKQNLLTTNPFIVVEKISCETQVILALKVVYEKMNNISESRNSDVSDGHLPNRAKNREIFQNLLCSIYGNKTKENLFIQEIERYAFLQHLKDHDILEKQASADISLVQNLQTLNPNLFQIDSKSQQETFEFIDRHLGGVSPKRIYQD